jgi:hypothetical protein
MKRFLIPLLVLVLTPCIFADSASIRDDFNTATFHRDDKSQETVFWNCLSGNVQISGMEKMARRSNSLHAEDVVFIDNYAFVLNSDQRPVMVEGSIEWHAGFDIYNVSDPSKVFIADSWWDPRMFRAPMEIDVIKTSDHHYTIVVASDHDGLFRILYCDDPENYYSPVTRGYFLHGELHGVKIMGDYVHIAAYKAGLLSFSIHSQEEFEAGPVGECSFGGKLICESLDVVERDEGIFAFIVENEDEKPASPGPFLRIVDVSNPETPKWLYNSDLDLVESAYDIVVDQNYAYIANGRLGVRIVDVTQLDRPVSLSLTQTSSGALSLAVHDHDVYVADGSQGVVKFESSSSFVLKLRSCFDTEGYAKKVAFFFDSNRHPHILIADQDGGFYVVKDNNGVPANVDIAVESKKMNLASKCGQNITRVTLNRGQYLPLGGKISFYISSKSGEAFWNPVTPGVPLNIPSDAQGDCLMWKAIMNSGSTGVTPLIDWIQLDYEY